MFTQTNPMWFGAVDVNQTIPFDAVVAAEKLVNGIVEIGQGLSRAPCLDGVGIIVHIDYRHMLVRELSTGFLLRYTFS